MNPLPLEKYAEEINLFQPFKPAAILLSSLQEREHVVDQLLAELKPTVDRWGNIQVTNYVEKRRLLHAALNMLEPQTLQPTSIGQLDGLLQAERQDRPIINSDQLAQSAPLEIGQTKVLMWQGDITTLKVDAIVNAANDRLLGCFQPLHSCIDNAIHTNAGVQLRDDCHTIMQKQAIPEPTGTAKITRAYNLPSRFVLHTVGPIVQGALTAKHVAALQSAYTSCLDLAAEVDGLRSVAFCCISTGVFGYPQDKASGTAFETVCNWLEQNPGRLDHVIFNVFTDQDRVLYGRLLR